MAPDFQPQTCIIAREFEGMTQTALAKLLGVSQGKISKIEDGTLSVSEDTVLELAAVFNRPTSFFYRSDFTVSGLEGFYRKRCNLPKKTQAKANALMNLERLRIQALDQIHNKIPKVPFCDPDEYQGGAKEIAQLARKFYNVPSGPIENLTAIVEKAGCVVRYVDYGTLKIDGFSVLAENHTPIIFINRAYPPDRRRLTLAHEFGHILMHREPRPEMEDEAFEFAGEFLMPEKEIRHAMYPLKVDKLAAMKLRWGVAMAAILMHAKRMGAITDRYYRYLYMQLGKMGYRTAEPHSDRIPLEPARKLSKMTTYLKSHHKLTDADLIEALAILPQELRLYTEADDGNRFTVI